MCAREAYKHCEPDLQKFGFFLVEIMSRNLHTLHGLELRLQISRV